MASAPGHISPPLLKIVLLHLCLILTMAEERRDCREQEYKDQFGNCIVCQQCDAGQELSKECGFGYGEGAQCMPCRASRFKEDRSLQKCKPCLDCALLNRLQKANCSTISNAVCGDCLPGFYRKTKLSGFQDMECIPCGDPPPPYEPHCIGRVNLVPIPSTVTSPRDMALAAVICSALATVLLALLILCVIYCKRQFLEKKPALLRSQDGPFTGAELSCLDRRRVLEFSEHQCCHCHHMNGQTCGPVHFIPSLSCEETHSQDHGQDNNSFQSQNSLTQCHIKLSDDGSQNELGQNPWLYPLEFSEVWPLMENAAENPRPTQSKDSSPEEDQQEENLQKEQRLNVATSKHTSDVLQDGGNLSDAHCHSCKDGLPTKEG